MLRWFNIAVLFLGVTISVNAANIPNAPKDPTSEFIFNDTHNKTYPASITRSGKGEKTGYINLRIESISVVYQKKTYSFTISEIKSIEFIEWQEFKHKNNAYVFHPSQVLLILNNNQKYFLEGLPEFYKVEFSGNNKTENFYSYFYDYWKNNKWVNSKNSDRSYPARNPLPGTLIKIDFAKEN